MLIDGKLRCDGCGHAIPWGGMFIHTLDGEAYCSAECGHSAGVCDRDGNVSEEDCDNDAVYWTSYASEEEYNA